MYLVCENCFCTEKVNEHNNMIVFRTFSDYRIDVSEICL